MTTLNLYTFCLKLKAHSSHKQKSLPEITAACLMPTGSCVCAQLSQQHTECSCHLILAFKNGTARVMQAPLDLMTEQRCTLVCTQCGMIKLQHEQHHYAQHWQLQLLLSTTSQPVGILDGCTHHFCYCQLPWCQYSCSCLMWQGLWLL